MSTRFPFCGRGNGGLAAAFFVIVAMAVLGGAFSAQAGPEMRAASQPVTTTPHDISGAMLRSNIEATDFQLDALFQHIKRSVSIRHLL